jgi:hypothetical protein
MFVTEVTTFDFYPCLILAENKNKGMEEVKYICVRSYGLVGFIIMPWAMIDICLDAASVGRQVPNKFEL